MTRITLCKRIAAKTGITADAVDTILTIAMEEIKHTVNRGEPVTLRTFGTFYRYNQPEKVGRFLATNTPLRIPARHAVRFKPGKTWKNEIQQTI